jgi:hypothetical protein
VETDRSLTQFQTRVQWVDDAQDAHQAFRDLSEPVTDYDDQRQRLEAKFSALADFAGNAAGADTIRRLAAVESFSL